MNDPYRNTMCMMQALTTVSMAVIQADLVCTDIADLDFKHISERTEIAGHR